jgi:hypothetical protein
MAHIYEPGALTMCAALEDVRRIGTARAGFRR